MSATSRPEEEQLESAAGTLGALLYADQSKARVAEREWVALVQGTAAGNQASLRTLYERTHRLVFTLAMRITRDPHSAEELTVDAFHDVWRRASTYDAAAETVIGWIMNDTRSRAIERTRLEQRKQGVIPHPDGNDAAEVENDSSETLDLTTKSCALKEALARMSPDERAAIETVYFAEITYAEAAERLNQPLGTVKTHIRSGLAKLRDALAAGEHDG